MIRAQLSSEYWGDNRVFRDTIRVDNGDDLIELTAAETRDLAAQLVQLADQIDGASAASAESSPVSEATS